VYQKNGVEEGTSLQFVKSFHRGRSTLCSAQKTKRPVKPPYTGNPALQRIHKMTKKKKEAPQVQGQEVITSISSALRVCFAHLHVASNIQGRRAKQFIV
jgi:hypothetical protein